jgi:hypothetical protein
MLIVEYPRPVVITVTDRCSCLFSGLIRLIAPFPSGFMPMLPMLIKGKQKKMSTEVFWGFKTGNLP